MKNEFPVGNPKEEWNFRPQPKVQPRPLHKWAGFSKGKEIEHCCKKEDDQRPAIVTKFPERTYEQDPQPNLEFRLQAKQGTAVLYHQPSTIASLNLRFQVVLSCSGRKIWRRSILDPKQVGSVLWEDYLLETVLFGIPPHHNNLSLFWQPILAHWQRASSPRFEGSTMGLLCLLSGRNIHGFCGFQAIPKQFCFIHGLPQHHCYFGLSAHSTFF